MIPSMQSCPITVYGCTCGSVNGQFLKSFTEYGNTVSHYFNFTKILLFVLLIGAKWDWPLKCGFGQNSDFS